MNKSIFKTFDIRGLYPEEINAGVAREIARACLKIFPDGEIIVAHDARHGSVEIAEAVASTCEQESEALGKKVTIRRIGLSSTPMFYFLVNHLSASGGCMITASHNPKQYNGMKIVGKNAEIITGTEILKNI